MRRNWPLEERPTSGVLFTTPLVIHIILFPFCTGLQFILAIYRPYYRVDMGEVCDIEHVKPV